MKKLRNFNCPKCGVFERMVTDEVTAVKCECGKEAKRTLSAPKCFQNTVGRSPSAN